MSNLVAHNQSYPLFGGGRGILRVDKKSGLTVRHQTPVLHSTLYKEIKIMNTLRLEKIKITNT